MTVRNSFAGLPPFLFGDGGLHNQLVCDVRTFVRANDGSRDLLAPMLAWSVGPPAIGDTGDNSTSHMTGTTWLLQVCPDGSWVLYREDRGRLEVVPWDDPPDPVGPTARHVSLAFDQAARVALAWEEAGIIKVRRWDPTANEYIENVSFAGVDPVIVFDATWAYRIPDSDVLLFYLSSDREKVLCRVQRDVYATPYEIWDFGAPVILDRVAALPYRYQVLVADGSGSPLPEVLVSGLYPVAALEGAAASALALDGEYLPVVLRQEQTEEALVTALALDGSYSRPIVSHSQSESGALVTAVALNGVYRSPIIDHGQTEMVVAEAIALSGEYELAVVRYSQPEESVGVAAVALDGEYTL